MADEWLAGFARFLHGEGIIRFGDYVLASGRSSPYYVDLRMVPSHPAEFRGMVKRLEQVISDGPGMDGFDCIASVPTGGLVVASALAMEAVKPLVYVRSSPKAHGTSKSVEGAVRDGMRAVLVDDVATTGGSAASALGELARAGVVVSDAYVIVDRLEGAAGRLAAEGVRLHALADMLQITESLAAGGLVGGDVLDRVRAQAGP